MADHTFDPVSMDTETRESEHRASIEHLKVESGNKRLLGVLFRAQGRGPHPTAVILHGFPGHDRNLDIAHTLRRGGLNSLVFHYRGTWGSDGKFSFSNMLEDTRAILKYIRVHCQDLSVDTERIFLISHSMGGWSAMMSALEDEDIRCIVNFAGFNLGALKDWVLENELNMEIARMTLERLSSSVNATQPEQLLKEVLDRGDEWNLIRHSPELSRKSILLIWAKNDQLALPPLHFHPMYESLLSAGASDLATHMIDSDHSFSDGRIELQDTIWNWVKKKL